MRGRLRLFICNFKKNIISMTSSMPFFWPAGDPKIVDVVAFHANILGSSGPRCPVESAPTSHRDTVFRVRDIRLPCPRRSSGTGGSRTIGTRGTGQTTRRHSHRSSSSEAAAALRSMSARTGRRWSSADGARNPPHSPHWWLSSDLQNKNWIRFVGITQDKRNPLGRKNRN